jgi:hypothetical protein
MTEQDDLSDIIDDSTEAQEGETEAPEPQEQEAEAVAPEPQEQEAEEQPEPTTEQAPQMVPHAVVGELRADNRALREQIQQLQRMMQPAPEQKPAPDFYDDPQGAVQHQITPIQQQLNAQKLQTSRFLAVEKFGEELVQQAHAYFDQHPEQSQALMNHPSPYHAAVAEYQKAQIAQEVGSDPVAYRDKIKAEVAAEIRKELEAKQTAAAVANAPSLAGQTSIGGRAAQAPTMTPLDDILGS